MSLILGSRRGLTTGGDRVLDWLILSFFSVAPFPHKVDINPWTRHLKNHNVISWYDLSDAYFIGYHFTHGVSGNCRAWIQCSLPSSSSLSAPRRTENTISSDGGIKNHINNVLELALKMCETIEWKFYLFLSSESSWCWQWIHLYLGSQIIGRHPPCQMPTSVGCFPRIDENFTKDPRF